MDDIIPANTKKNKSALDSIEHELYDPKVTITPTEVHRMSSRRSLDLPSSWGDDAPIIVKGQEEKGLSFGMIIFLVSTILLFVALGFSAWRIMSLRNVVSTANIDMTADITPYIEGGEDTPLNFTLLNRNSSKLLNANVTLSYKQGNGSLDEEEKKQEKREIGEISPGEYKKQDFKVQLYGSESETRDITLKLEYKVAGSNATFTKVITSQVILRTPPISVSGEGPSTLSVGQSGTYVFTVKNNSATTSLPSVFQLQFPTTFSIESSNPKPLPRSYSWAIAPLKKGESQTISVTGSSDAKPGDSVTIQAKIGSVGDDPSLIGVVYASQNTDITLRASPLTLLINLSTDRGSDEILRYGDKATLRLNYNNSSAQALEDVSIKLYLSGDAAIYNSIDPTNGYYDSVNKTITWDRASVPDLAILAPNSQGTLVVNIPIVSKGNNSPTLKATLSGSASTKSSNDVIASISKTFGVQGSATLVASTQYKTSPFANSGPVPPRPNQETTYTVLLSVSAQNALSSASVSFVLPAYVTWKNQTDVQNISYDTKTRTVTWNVGRLDQGKSVSANVGLMVKPSQSHVGQSPSITSGIVLNADEEVSKAHLRTTLSPLTTSVKGELWPENPALVVDK